jgi:hypothetical protein
MKRFARRVIGAARLDRRVYEEVETDVGALGQALLIVTLSSVAAGVGWPGGRLAGAPILAGSVAALLGWVAWAFLTYFIGTRLLPEPQTQADPGQLLRTIGFAASPGLLRVLGAVPGLAVPVFIVVSLWMLVAMIVAVGQALDYSSPARALAVCATGWLLSLIFIIVIGLFFGPTVH